MHLFHHQVKAFVQGSEGFLSKRKLGDSPQLGYNLISSYFNKA
jgi:hypothetical protein